MQDFYQGRGENLSDMFHRDGIAYAISMGRRAPMHRMHVDCLHEIVNAGLIPVIGIGSTNGATSPLYNPINNPLNEREQREQLRRLIHREFPQQADTMLDLIFSQEDLGHAEKWSKAIAQTMRNKGIFGSCVLHFRAKENDTQPNAKNIRALSDYTKILAEHGIPSWGSYNINSDDDAIHASDMRKWDLNRLSDEQKALFAEPDYVINLANAARDNNPAREFLEKARIPVTMQDLSLERLRVEAGISIQEIIEQATTTEGLSLATLTPAITTVLEQLQKYSISKAV